MSSKNLSLVAVGLQARHREINHRQGHKNSKKDGNGQAKKGQNQNWSSQRASRGFRMGSAGKQDSIAEALDDGPILRSGKKNNFNHLLSFQNYTASPESKTINRTRRYSNKRHVRTKEDFVQATSQFVIREGCELELLPFEFDPDLSIPWKYIEVVRFFSQEQTECPICLHPPIAAQVGRCGHAHCYSCVLKLLTITEKPQCPVCNGHMKRTDLRSAILDVERRPTKGTSVEFVKMKRARSSITADILGTDENTNFLGRYRRIVPKGASDLITNILDREDAELTVQEFETEESEKPFIQQAKELVSQRKAQLTEHIIKDEVTKKRCTKTQLDGKPMKVKEEKMESPEVELSTTKAEEEKSEPMLEDEKSIVESPNVEGSSPEAEEDKSELREADIQTSVEKAILVASIVSDLVKNLNFGAKDESNIDQDKFPKFTQEVEELKIETPYKNSEEDLTTSPVDDNYYFYQAVGCSNLYLGSLNAKCIITQFGSIKEAPERFSSSLVELEDFTMEQDLRKRFRYLSHLSAGETFSLAYVNVNELGVSKETLKTHKSHITAKNKKLKAKDREEDKVCAEIKEYYDREVYGKYRDAQFEITSDETFPDLKESPDDSPIKPIVTSTGVSGAWMKKTNSTFDLDNDFVPLSGPSPPSKNNFWDTMKASTKTEETLSVKVEDTEEPEELRAPKNRCFGDDFASAINAAKRVPKHSESEFEEDKKPKRAQKKKKGRIILSF